MKKSLCLVALAGMVLAACQEEKGTVTIRLPHDFNEKNIIVSHILLDNSFAAQSADDVRMIYDTLEVKNGSARLILDKEGAGWYTVIPSVMSRQQPDFYAQPDDKLVVNIRSFDPMDYSVTGAELMDDMTAYLSTVRPIEQEHYALLQSNEDITAEQSKALIDRYDAAVKKFVAEHPKSPVVPYVITELSGDDFKSIYDNLTPEARKSILMPYAEAYNRNVEEMQQERAKEEERKAEVASGTITAPGFTLPDLAGKKVSLSDFRGKWVVLDFWGSWCGWCIKGFPALKEAYNKYGDKIVVIGIDCNESEEDWRAGVKKYQMPWLQLYNGNDRKLYEEYKIEGFPTKAIINPEGKLVDLTTGEDPTFYDRLASFVE